MHSGKNEEAATMLQEASVLLQQGKAEEPDNAKISQTEKKLDRLQENIDKKLGTSTTGPASSGQPLPDKPQPKSLSTTSAKPAPAAKQNDPTILPAGVKKRLDGINNNLDNAEEYAGKDANNATRWLKDAEETLNNIDKMYAGQFDPAHPDYVAAKNRYNELASKVAAQGKAEAKAETDAEGAKDAKEKQSAEWVAKFQEYLAYSSSEGHNPAKLVFVPGTSEPEKFDDAKKRYETFKKFYDEYKKTDFPAGRTFELEDIADNQTPRCLKEFEEGFASRLSSASAGAENEITALGPDTPQAKQIQKKFDTLAAKDKENREIRKERTFMTPDQYTGTDIKALKEKAEDLVKGNVKEGGKPLRCTVIAQNWREETVREWTDTSRTAERWRTTRHQTAQVAAKTSDGIRLITVALAQDKQSDSNWGPLYGNLHQGSDPMLESNVTKNGP